jgi:transcriptional regulator with XRE-family HTH domain
MADDFLSNKNNLLENPRKATSVDHIVARRIRQRRELLKITRDQLANTLNISRTSLQKYESGEARVSPGRLASVAAALGVDVGFFFNWEFDPSTADTVSDSKSIRESLIAIFNSLEESNQRQLLAIALTFPQAANLRTD